jgi:hypothetical protein
MKNLSKNKKVVLSLFMFFLLIFGVWVFYLNKKSVKEQFDILVEHMDPNQNIPTEPEQDKNTGLYLKSNNPEDIQKYVVSMMNNVLQVNEAGQIPGRPGPQGIQGKDGANGGMYQRVGSILNQKYPEKVIERTAGMGKGAVIYANNQKYKQWQQWQLDKNNKLRSVYKPEQCLTHDDDGGEPYMAPCINSKQWVHRASNGALMSKYPVNGEALCLSLKSVNNHPSNTIIGTKQKGINGDLITLEKCDNSREEQMWQWL